MSLELRGISRKARYEAQRRKEIPLCFYGSLPSLRTQLESRSSKPTKK